jgi:2-polyprenyl-3-methyl-5-hydroxy-6-metoxy-1,4-benzoquinol methylase
MTSLDSSSLQASLLSETEADGVIRTGEYSRRGEFHRNLDPNWSYYPIYVNKVELVDELLHQFGTPKGKTLDAGCGEGVLVEKYHQLGWDICGFDKNYQSDRVLQGDMNAIPFDGYTFDQVMCLDVLEHLPYEQQLPALLEMRRVLKADGVLILSVPNLAHFTSRLKMMFRGRMLRTASIHLHPGDRPAKEYEELIEAASLKILHTAAIFPTVPPLYRYVMRNPAKSAGLLRFLRKLPIPPYWQFQVLFVCQPVFGTP